MADIQMGPARIQLEMEDIRMVTERIRMEMECSIDRRTHSTVFIVRMIWVRVWRVFFSLKHIH